MRVALAWRRLAAIELATGAPKRASNELRTTPPHPPTMYSQDALNWVRNWNAGVDIRCGGSGAPPNPPFDASLYPFTTLTKLDFQGYPNCRDKRLEANLSLGPTGWYVGYEDGEFVAAGRFSGARRLRWELEINVLSTTHVDTFIEFVVEPNPRNGVYSGPDRMRCLSGALAQTWTGRRLGTAWFEVQCHGPRDFQTHGEVHLPAVPNAAELRRAFDVRRVNAEHDTTRFDALWQLRWRIDRLAHLDVYDSTYQVGDATNGAALERELVVTQATFRGL